MTLSSCALCTYEFQLSYFFCLFVLLRTSSQSRTLSCFICRTLQAAVHAHPDLKQTRALGGFVPFHYGQFEEISAIFQAES